jgi:molecular chaperone DnaJ
MVKVEVPAGVAANNYLTLRGQGAAGARNGQPGDLLVMLNLEEDERFERQGQDLYYDLPVSFSQAALGGEFAVPTPYGDENATVPPGTQTGTVLRLRGKGLPHLGRAGTGDLNIRIHVWTPEKPTSEQQELFRQLAKVEGGSPSGTRVW